MRNTIFLDLTQVKFFFCFVLSIYLLYHHSTKFYKISVVFFIHTNQLLAINIQGTECIFTYRKACFLFRDLMYCSKKPTKKFFKHLTDFYVRFVQREVFIFLQSNI